MQALLDGQKLKESLEEDEDNIKIRWMDMFCIPVNFCIF